MVVTLGSTSTRAEQRTVLVVVKAMDNPFFVDIARGVREEFSRSGQRVDLLVRSGAQEGDVTGQREQLESAIGKYLSGTEPSRLSALILTPAGSGDELTSQIKRFHDAHVPIILLDTRISDDALTRAGTTYDMYAGSNNRQGGEIAAAAILKRLPRGGRILLLNGVTGHETAAERRTGFLSIIQKANKTRKKYIVIERTANWRRSEAQAAVDGLLSLGRRFDAVFAANDEMALGALVSFQRLSAAQRPPIIGFDAIDDARAAVKKGLLFGTVAQDPYGMGVAAAQAAMNLWSRKKITKDRTIAVHLITQQ